MVFQASSQAGALILGGAHGSLAVIRSLGRRGIAVRHLSEAHSLCRYSRYVQESRSWGGAATADAVPFLLQYCDENRLDGWMLVPAGDAEARLIAENHRLLSQRFKLVTPPWETISILYDKQLMYAEASRLGIPVPEQFGIVELLAGREKEIRFPLVIKPATREAANALTRAKAWRVNDAAELAVKLRQAVAMMGMDAVIVQELIPGGGARQYSYAAVWKDGTPVASLVARRSRQFPVDFGFTSTFVETVDDPGIREMAERLLSAAGYHGLVEVEFKHDARTGEFKILDINTRVWTWIGLGELAGVDFAYLMWRIARDLPVRAAGLRPAVAWTHLSRDLVAAAHEFLRGSLSWRAYLRSLTMPHTSAAFAGDDPKPGLLDIPLLVPRLLKRLFPARATCPDDVKPLPRPRISGERHGFRQTGGR